MVKYIISSILILSAGAAFFLYTKPAYDGVQGAIAENAQYDGALTKAAQLQAVKSDLLQKYNAMPQDQRDRLQKLLPDHVDNVALILDLDNLANRYGLGLENVDVSTPASAASSKTAVGAVAGAGQKYDSVTIKFTTHGTYTQFTQFLSELEASLRIVDLQSLSIAGSGTGSDTSGEPYYTYSITLRTYWLK